MKRTEIIEMIKDAAFFGGNIQNEHLKECRDFFDNVIEKQLTIPVVVDSDRNYGLCYNEAKGRNRCEKMCGDESLCGH